MCSNPYFLARSEKELTREGRELETAKVYIAPFHATSDGSSMSTCGTIIAGCPIFGIGQTWGFSEPFPF